MTIKHNIMIIDLLEDFVDRKQNLTRHKILILPGTSKWAIDAILNANNSKARILDLI